MYKIVGADNKEYGPVSQEEILQWIAQGRANAQTIARFEEGAWKPLATFDEFKAALNIPVTPVVGGEFTAIPPVTSAASFKPGAKANSAAIAGVVFGVLGLGCCCCPFVPSVFSILAIVFGAVGINQIKSRPGFYTTDASLAKVAIGLGLGGLLLQAAFQIFGTGLSKAIEKAIKIR